MTKTEYLNIVCDIWDETPKQYKKTMKDNFVILEGGETPLVWDTDGRAVIYGGKEDYELDMMEGDTVITEQEYFDKFLED